MGQKVHPTGVRVGIIKDWNSKWYADSRNFADYLVEDQTIRKFLKNKLYTAGISIFLLILLLYGLFFFLFLLLNLLQQV